jgi:CheY-like chemotaxis protein
MVALALYRAIGATPLAPVELMGVTAVRTVLVVEDDVPIAITLRFILEDAGYRAIVARNGREALKVATELRPDLVVSDVAMPIMGGVELVRRIQEDPDLCATRIVLMSAMREPVEDGLVYQAFIQKPFSIDALLDLVDRLTEE